ncbi:hypothetical protein [Halobacterium litoreum]|uniref:Uncharacterized protein n=1 Tax=Halobacterium litoreum TaxID=2039234 RepID=A0ABD5NAK1_9EURY|nr:hypothetical protein [Halobacterium litoreum]UHH14765.1 hypothetical protein LT972_07115 [Halobacterium litoreum]
MSERDVVLFGIALILASGFFHVAGLLMPGDTNPVFVYGILGGLVVSLLGTVASVTDESN